MSEKVLCNQHRLYNGVTGVGREEAIDVLYLEFKEVSDTASHDFFIYKQAKEM